MTEIFDSEDLATFHTGLGPDETLTKAHLAELLTQEFGYSKRQSIKLSGFGSFQLRDKPERPGRNPKTGKEIAITARRVVTFHTSPKLRDMVEANSKLIESKLAK